jgi:hypothetical protein
MTSAVHPDFDRRTPTAGLGWQLPANDKKSGLILFIPTKFMLNDI